MINRKVFLNAPKACIRIFPEALLLMACTCQSQPQCYECTGGNRLTGSDAAQQGACRGSSTTDSTIDLSIVCLRGISQTQGEHTRVSSSGEQDNRCVSPMISHHRWQSLSGQHLDRDVGGPGGWGCLPLYVGAGCTEGLFLLRFTEVDIYKADAFPCVSQASIRSY